MPRGIDPGIRSELSRLFYLLMYQRDWLRVESIGGGSVMLNKETAWQFARRANVERYRKILGTYLTAEERRFVERRLTEEQAALQQLAGSAASIDTPT